MIPFASPPLRAAARRLAVSCAALVTLAACDSSSAPRPQVAARLEVVAGNDQEAQAGATLASPLVVRVSDQKGKAVEGQIVNFRVVSGGGSVFAGTAQTNSNGEVREQWTLGVSTAAADSQRVEVRAVDAATGQPLVLATFRATARAGAAASAASVGPLTRGGVAGGVVADSLTVRVADQYGNPVNGVSVAWAPSTGGSVSPATSTTRADGTTRAQWTLAGTAAAQTVTATPAGLPPVTFTATPGPAAVARVDITPASFRFNALGRTQPVTVAAFDRFGNPVQGAAATVISLNSAVVALNGNAVAQAVGNGTTFVTATVQGVADTVEVTVQQVAASVAVTPDTASLVAGDTLRLRATAADSGGAAIAGFQPRWRTADASVALVSAAGLVTGVGSGTAAITAAADAAEATARVRVRVPLVASALDAGASHTCAVTADGTYCWGSNATRQLGGSGGNVGAPKRVTGAPVFAALSGGGAGVQPAASFAIGETCGITQGGGVSCWGNDIARQVGGSAGTEICRISLNYSYRCRGTVEQVGGVTGVAQLSAGALHVCAVTGTGQAYCWGNNQYGELGTSAPVTEGCPAEANLGSVPCSSTALPVAGGLTFRKVAAGAAFTCGITTGGDAYCWGRNNVAQLGVMGIESSPTPVAVQGGHRFTDISVGLEHACGVTADGRVLCWGSNNRLQFGTGAVLGYTATPYQVSQGIAFRTISAGTSHSCGLATNGAAYCFGNTENGKRGNGDNVPGGPVAVAGGMTFSQISVGAEHSCAVQAGTDEVYCWGQRSLGAVGNGIDTPPQATPARVLMP